MIVHSKLLRYCYSSCLDKPIHQKIGTQDTQYLVAEMSLHIQ
jgi:hypothetical protein